VPATAFTLSNGVCTGPTPPLVGVPRGGRGPSTGTQQAANRGASVAASVHSTAPEALMSL